MVKTYSSSEAKQLNLYTSKFHSICLKHLVSQQHATIHEYRNFIDFCIIPIIKELLKDEIKNNDIK